MVCKAYFPIMLFITSHGNIELTHSVFFILTLNLTSFTMEGFFGLLGTDKEMA